jgi:hypothetical protein
LKDFFPAAKTFVTHLGDFVTKLGDLVSAVETFSIRLAALILLGILIYKLICNEMP